MGIKQNNKLVDKNFNSTDMSIMPKIKFLEKKCIINADNVDYKTLNYAIRSILKEIDNSQNSDFPSKINKIELDNILGQRYYLTQFY